VQITTTTYTVASPSNNFASLENITNDSYEYTLELNVSKPAVNTTNAVTLVVRTYKINPLNSITTSIFRNGKTSSVLEQDPAFIIEQIQRKPSTNSSEIFNARSKNLTINSFDLIDLIAKNNAGIGFASINQQPNVVVNVVQTNTNRVNQIPLAIDRTIPQVSTNLLKQEKTDPAQAIVRTYSTNTAFDTSNGALGVDASSKPLNNQINQIAGELLSTNSLAQIQQPPTYITYMIADQDQILVRVPISFAKNIVGQENFYVLCTIFDQQENILQEFIELIDHSTNVIFFKRPYIPPVFQASKQPNGEIAFTFTQKDNNATGVLVYQTVYNQTDSTNDTSQQLVATYNIEYGQTQTFLFQNQNLGLLLFRALSFNETGTSTDFTSQVIEASTPNEDSINNNVFLTLNYEYSEQGLKVLISNIPNDIMWINLYKTNITVDPNTETLISTFNVGGMGRNNLFGYLDNDLDNGKNYCYRATVFDIYGNELDSTGLIEINYRPQVSSYAAVTVTDQLTTVLGTGASVAWDVSFAINYAIVPGLEQNVRELLTSQNLIQYYGTDIIATELQQLLVTKIELRDLDTNDKYFIAFADSNFVQSRTNFGLIKKPAKYVYELTTYTRHPTTLLQANVQVGKSQPRPSTNNVTPRLPEVPEYQYKPFNVTHPEGLLTGTVPKSTGKEFVENTGYNQLEFGEIVNIQYLPVDLLNPIPSITQLQAFKLNKHNVQLSWSVNGDQTKISHFIVRRQNVLTKKLDLIGKAHGINVLNNYTFVDPIRPTDNGVYQYIITIQFFDMTISTDYSSNEVVI
jgi:hypothetical protein